MGAVLNDFQRSVFQIISTACRAGAISPRLSDMTQQLGLEEDEKNHKVKHAIDVMVRGRVLQRTSRPGKRAIYKLPGTKHRTVYPEEAFAGPYGSELLAERAKLLYEAIALRCRRNGYTPTYPQLERVIRGNDAKGRSATVSVILNKLELQGLIQREGASHNRIFRLPGTNFATRPVPFSDRENPFSTKGWPRPTAISIAAYDAAMALKPYADPDQNVIEIVRPPRRLLPKVQHYSECGSAAAMCAAF